MPVLAEMRKSISNLAMSCFTVACLSVMLFGQTTNAQPVATATPQGNTSEKVFRIDATTRKLAITERFSRVVELQNKITRVDGFDPEVMSVTALSPFQLRLQAKTPGVTTMVLTDEFDQSFSIEVFVEGDVRHLQAYIDRLFPGSAVRAIKIPDGVVLRGWVSDPNHVTEIVDIAGRFFPAPNVLNQMKLGGVNQVQLSVKVMEVQRSRIRQLGFNWLWFGDNGYLASTPGALTPLAGVSLPFGGPGGASVSSASLGNSTLTFGLASASSVFQGFLEALKSEGLLKIKAEPRVTTTSGRPAKLLAGGRFPILVPQGVGTVSIEWVEFGTSLEAVPIVLGDGNLRLEISPEVSERDFSNAVQVDGFTVPGLTTRTVNTAVEMKFGQTLIIGGLIASRYTAETKKTPLLGELPWIGAAFRRMNYNETETELLIMVTPELVAPQDANQVTPVGPGELTDVPSDYELYFQGLMEVPVHAGGRGHYGGGNGRCPSGRCRGGSCNCGLNGDVNPAMSPAGIPPFQGHPGMPTQNSPLIPMDSMRSQDPKAMNGQLNFKTQSNNGLHMKSNTNGPFDGASVPPSLTPVVPNASPFIPPEANSTPPAPKPQGLIPLQEDNQQSARPFPANEDSSSVTQRYQAKPTLYSRLTGRTSPSLKSRIFGKKPQQNQNAIPVGYTVPKNSNIQNNGNTVNPQVYPQGYQTQQPYQNNNSIYRQ